jgi:hypothetical protein
LTGEILEWLRANAPDVQFVAMEGAGSKTPQTAAASAEGTLQFVLVYRGPHGLLYKRV